MGVDCNRVLDTTKASWTGTQFANSINAKKRIYARRPRVHHI